MKNIAALRQYILRKITPPMQNQSSGYLSLNVCNRRRIPCHVFRSDDGRGWIEDMNDIPEPFTPEDIQNEMTDMIAEAFNHKFTYAAKRAKNDSNNITYIIAANTIQPKELRIL